MHNKEIVLTLKKTKTMIASSSKERLCQQYFKEQFPFWHCYTCGKTTSILFTSEDTFIYAMNSLAFASYASRGIKLIAFEIMNNHFHFIISAKDPDAIQDFYFLFIKQLSKLLPDCKNITLNIKPIPDLRAIRNTIVYVHRNAYVSNSIFTPYNYPWSSGSFYFCTRYYSDEYSRIKFSTKRTMFKGRVPDLPDDWKIINGYISPENYCDIHTGMNMFRDARHYFVMLSKDVESYRELAVELDDTDFLSDEELFLQIYRILKEEYRVTKLSELSKAQVLDVAYKLHFDYRSSNQQIVRLLKLSIFEVNNLFPTR